MSSRRAWTRLSVPDSVLLLIRLQYSRLLVDRTLICGLLSVRLTDQCRPRSDCRLLDLCGLCLLGLCDLCLSIDGLDSTLNTLESTVDTKIFQAAVSTEPAADTFSAAAAHHGVQRLYVNVECHSHVCWVRSTRLRLLRVLLGARALCVVQVRKRPFRDVYI
jgi:hypothetical protein